MDPNTQSVSTEDLLCLLADPQRRAVLSELLDRDDATASVQELVAALTAQDRVSGRSQGAEHGRVSVRLRHNHLPRLADAGIVDYDRQHGTVRYRPHERVEALLEFISERFEQ